MAECFGKVSMVYKPKNKQIIKHKSMKLRKHLGALMRAWWCCVLTVDTVAAPSHYRKKPYTTGPGVAVPCRQQIEPKLQKQKGPKQAPI